MSDNVSSSNTLTVDAAKQRCLACITPINAWQQLALRNALTRVLAQNIIAPINVPAHANSAMDGYALRATDLTSQTQLRVIATAYAGRPYNDKIGENECVKIMTGAIIPSGADVVVPQECTQCSDDQVEIVNYSGGSNIRPMGEDLAKGSIALKQGRLLSASDLGLIASLGIAEVPVYRQARVAFFSTGDELCALTEQPKIGQLYDSNRYALFALLQRLNIDILDLGVIVDQPEALKSAFLQAAETADVIITTGGVSVGAADYVKSVLSEIGEINFWQLAIKPGRPLTYGKIHHAHFFGLPGNPVAAMVTFYQIVQPFLRHLMGQTIDIETPLIQAKCLSTIKKKPGRKRIYPRLSGKSNR